MSKEATSSTKKVVYLEITSTIPNLIVGFSSSTVQAVPLPKGALNRKLDCPDCGPKMRTGYEKFCREVDRDLKKERRKRGDK